MQRRSCFVRRNDNPSYLHPRSPFVFLVFAIAFRRGGLFDLVYVPNMQELGSTLLVADSSKLYQDTSVPSQDLEEYCADVVDTHLVRYLALSCVAGRFAAARIRRQDKPVPTLERHCVPNTCPPIQPSSGGTFRLLA